MAKRKRSKAEKREANASVDKKPKNKADGKKKATKESDENKSDDELEMDFDELVAASGALQQLGASEAAAESLEKAHAMRPDDVDVLASLAAAYEASDDKEKAIKTYEKVVAAPASNALSWFSLGTLYQEHEQLDKAISAFRKVIDLDEENVSVTYAALANCYGDKGDIDGAVGVFEAAVAKFPENANYQYNLATMLVARGTKDDQKKAITLYEKAATLSTDRQEEIYEDLAQLLDSMGEKKQAKQARKKIESCRDRN
ncbi:hypothetical protein THRCLA_22223 [Thraustotheca clavata]|uniref:Uncharacterized protein n=1 Tax=Thraustotheca clavata TaxID=74557 RepID=A0A1V9Z9D7_9STRA|nr:hypothetical protein THRCLA_22223 [Thraustotheca clavata]